MYKKHSTALRLIVIGVALGALSWAIVPLVSDRFEAYDSELGFYLGQAILSLPAAYFGFRLGLRGLAIFLAGAYIGINIYAFMFASADSRAMPVLGLIVTLSLLIYPSIAGIIAYFAAQIKAKLINK